MSKEIQDIVRLILIRLGIKCDLIGFTFLYHSVLMTIEDPDLIYDMDKLFELVAKKCNIDNPYRVEANMQSCIKHTYKNYGFEYINTLYGMKILTKDRKPTSAEIIKLIAEYISLGLYKNANLLQQTPSEQEV